MTWRMMAVNGDTRVTFDRQPDATISQVQVDAMQLDFSSGSPSPSLGSIYETTLEHSRLN